MVELVTVSVPLVVDAAAVAAGRVVGDGGVGDRQRAVVDRCRRRVAGRVVGDGGVGDRQRAAVVDAAAAVVRARVVGDGGVGDRQRAATLKMPPPS